LCLAEGEERAPPATRVAATQCTGWGGSLLEFNGEADHVHLLVALPPNLDLSRLRWWFCQTALPACMGKISMIFGLQDVARCIGWLLSNEQLSAKLTESTS